jgi:acetyltransferase-like isoleucine patch superfamily enzyme
MKSGHRAIVDESVVVSPHVDLTIGDGSYLGPGVHIVGQGKVVFGDYCKVHAGCFINVGHGGYVIFGHNCWFGEQTVLDGAGGLSGGNNIGAGIGSQLYTHIAHGDTIEGCTFESKSEMVLEDDVWFVGQCFVSPIYAKEKAIALLGSVVTKDMEARRVYGGNPARDITDRIGTAWVDREPQTKLELLHRRIEEYSTIFPDRAAKTRELIVPCLAYPTMIDKEVSYFNVSRRRYTKRLSETEYQFMSWLTSYKGRYIPEEVAP